MRNYPRRRPIPIRRPSWLDQWVYRFQHRWETSPQYRAAVSGVCGLLLIVLMCSCMGVVATVTNAAFASIGGGSGGGSAGDTNTGTKQIANQQTFPTFTLAPYAVPTIQAGNVSDSQTPPPGPTVTPTDLPATATDTPGGGGVPQGACSGASSGGSWQFSPCPQTHGQSGSLIIDDSAYPNHTVNIVLSFGQCSGSASCTYLYTPSQGYQLDGSGHLQLNYTVPAQAQPNVAPESGMVNITGGPTITFTGPDVQ